MSGRPLDVLEAALGDRVRVHLKSGEAYIGELTGYDQHMNLVLEGTGEDGPAAADEEPASDAAESPSNESTETGPSAQDTTIIRGDNVVSINP